MTGRAREIIDTVQRELPEGTGWGVVAEYIAAMMVVVEDQLKQARRERDDALARIEDMRNMLQEHEKR